MENLDTQAKKISESKTLTTTTKVLGVLIVAFIIFSAGISVGYRKASFGRDWGEHYNENFGFNGGRMGVGMMGYFPNAHGANGEIIRTSLPNIIVEDNENTEKSVLLTENTKIQKGNNLLQATELNTGDFIVVIGTPNMGGVIEAKLVRVLPNPESIK
ncbi:hypothetical protein K2P96_00800 [Patescibacteria group bacterium]|nr:hypothetical protein [Patescibacteria group bacterium]